MQVTYTHLDGNVTVFTANTAINNRFFNPNTQAWAESITYINDWGMGTWAKERLSEADYQTFLTSVSTWDTSSPLLGTDDSFSNYWGQFISDSSVVVQE